MTAGESELSVIQRQTRVLSDTYAALPTTGLRAGDLAYATDRRTLYRWSGAAWEDITIYSDSGAYGDIPTASNLPEGSLYYATDTKVQYQVQSASWAAIITATGWTLLGSASPSAVATISVTFTAHDLIKVYFRLVAAASDMLNLRLNDITAADYYSRKIDTATIASVAAATSAALLDIVISRAVIGEILINGKHATGVKSFTLTGTPHHHDDYMMLHGNLENNSADLTKITLLSGANFTGEVQVYGKNF